MSHCHFFKRSIFAFLFLTALLTLATSYFMPDGEGNNNYFFLLMWSPGLAAVIVNLIKRKSLKGLGWKFSLKWMAIGWVLPIAYGALVYGTIWITGLGEVPNPTFLERARFTMGMQSESDSLIIISAFFYITVLSLIPNMIMSLGEELGWRGFLVPELFISFDFKKTALISGVIWSLWHLPGFLDGNYGQGSTPIALRLFCFLIMVLSGAVMLAWIRLESGSLWPAVVFHATHNGVILAFFERLTLDTGNTAYFSGEFGIGLAICSALFAWYFYKKPLTVNKIKPNKITEPTHTAVV